MACWFCITSSGGKKLWPNGSGPGCGPRASGAGLGCCPAAKHASRLHITKIRTVLIFILFSPYRTPDFDFKITDYPITNYSMLNGHRYRFSLCNRIALEPVPCMEKYDSPSVGTACRNF